MARNDGGEPPYNSVMPFSGILIEESLTSKDCLRLLRVVGRSSEKTTERHQTPWLRQWTMLRFEIDDATDASIVAASIQDCLDAEHASSWYVDFKNDAEHYIVFKDRLFRIDLSKPEQYDAVSMYGFELGMPPDQLDFGLTPP